MEFPPLNIKRETIDVEYEDKNTGLLEITCDVKVKVEDLQISDNIDWCITKETVCEDNNTLFCNVVGNDELKYQCNERCSRCYRIFRDSFSLLQHNVNHLRIKLSSCLLYYKYKCDICLVYYKTEQELEYHRVKHRKQKKLHGHMKVAHPDGEYYCGDCNVKFKCAQYLRRHLLYQHGKLKPSWRFHRVSDTEVKCSQCPIVFKNRRALTTHIRNCHGGSHECEICGSKLKSRPYLLTHVQRVHYDDGKKHKCEVCGKNYKSPRYLKVHMKNSRHLL